MNGPELYHHGILGQKWGVRRYQNDDGTWTTAGKERRRKLRKWDPRRFQNEDGSLTEEGKVRYMEAARRGKLNYKKLSNADLDMINTRFNKENIYKRNVKEAIAELPSTKIKNALLKVGEEAAKSALKALAVPVSGIGDTMKTAFAVDKGKGKGGEKPKGNDAKEEKPKGNDAKEEKPKKETPKKDRSDADEKVKKGAAAAQRALVRIGDGTIPLSDSEWRVD